MARENLLVVTAVYLAYMLLLPLLAKESYRPVVERALVVPVSQQNLSSRLIVYILDFLLMSN